ncbi:MAG TPA: type II CAAX endopeptidase family protein [Actinomycetota bacterium]|nr:type II CAAX endopeptidase family protein [Actinomycetota bacterium]
MDRPRTTDVTWSPLEAIPVLLIALAVTSLAGIPLLDRDVQQDFCGGAAVILNLVGELAFGVTVVLWLRYVSKASVAALRFPRQPLRDVASGIGVGVGLIFLGGFTLYLVREAVSLFTGEPPQQPEQIVACVRGATLAFMAPVVIVLAPICEEIFFRGFLYNGLRRRLPVWGAAVVSSVVFGLVHVHPLLIPPLFVVGLGLALLYERQQSLLAPVVAHATFNILGFVMIALGRQ